MRGWVINDQIIFSRSGFYGQFEPPIYQRWESDDNNDDDDDDYYYY